MNSEQFDLHTILFLRPATSRMQQNNPFFCSYIPPADLLFLAGDFVEPGALLPVRYRRVHPGYSVHTRRPHPRPVVLQLLLLLSPETAEPSLNN